MSVMRSRPGKNEVRTGRAVGPDYPEENYRNPFNMGIEKHYGNEHEKVLYSMNEQTVTGAGLPLHDDYDELYKGK